MKISRKTFLSGAIGLTTMSLLDPVRFLRVPSSHTIPASQDLLLPEWPFPDLSVIIKEPVVIRSVELMKTQGQFLMVVRSAEGEMGVTQCNNRIPHLTSLLEGLIIPNFVNKDARNLKTLVDDAYRLNSNYKYAGMPLWNCIGSVEIAVWDLLGKMTKKPAYALLGKPLRHDYEVYISDWSREGEVDGIVDAISGKLAATGARGVKVKIGGRMVNTKENDAQTKRYIPALRKKLGNDITIYADANGSYTAQEGIETGKLLEDYGIRIFEEPCNFEDEEGMRRVNKALNKLKLAGGEQDTSVYRFQRLARTGVYDILQPDLYYNGGILRTLQVCEIARKYSKLVAPHTPKADPLIAPFWQVAALAPNLYGLQECVYNPAQVDPGWYSKIQIVNGKMYIPDRPGLGIDYDEGIWKSAVKIVG